MSSIMKGIVDETEAKKGADGKRCWKGKRYAGTENGKDKCVPVKNEAANPAQQAAIAVNMKKKGQKPKNVDEAKAKQYVKPFMQDGKQVGWKSSDGYHVKYWQMFAKDSAIKHAKLNPDEVQEDYTGEFAAEKTPAINPYGGLKDNKFRGAIDETGVKYIVRSKDGVERGYSDPNSIGAQNWKRSYQRKEKPFKPEKIKKPSSDQIWQKVEHAISNYFPDGDPTDYLNPYMERNGLNWDDITRAAKKNGYKDLWDYWNTLTQDIENDAYSDWMASDGKNVRTRGQFMENELDEAKKSEFRLKTEQQQNEKLEKIKSSSLPHWAKEYLILLNDPKGKVFKAAYYSFPKGQAAREEAAEYIMTKYKVPKDMLNKVKHGEMAHMATDRPEDRNYDFDVPSVHEAQLDEKCWDSHKQVGMKKKDDKMVPNCVPKESAIMKGLRL